MSNVKLETSVVADHEKIGEGSMRSYVIGFVSSIVLTLVAYKLAKHGSLNRTLLITLVSGLALSQFMVQLICFLHLGLERKPRWKLLAFWFMIGIVLILVVGSIWIMTHLNYHMLPPAELKDYLHKNEGL